MNHSPINEAYLVDARSNRVIVLEDCNFIWDREELKQIVKMWKKGKSVEQMAEYFDRDPDEVLLACIHLAKYDRIIRRKGGLRGGK